MLGSFPPNLGQTSLPSLFGPREPTPLFNHFYINGVDRDVVIPRAVFSPESLPRACRGESALSGAFTCRSLTEFYPERSRRARAEDLRIERSRWSPVIVKTPNLNLS